MKKSYKRCGSCKLFFDCHKTKRALYKSCRDHQKIINSCKKCGKDVFSPNSSQIMFFCNHSCFHSHNNKTIWAGYSDIEKRERFEKTGLHKINEKIKDNGGKTRGVFSDAHIEKMRQISVENINKTHDNKFIVEQRIKTLKRIGEENKNRTYEEIHGEKKAKEIKNKLRIRMIGNLNGRKSKGGGKCKGYLYTSNKEEKYKIQGLYELMFIYYLDLIGESYTTHTGILKYKEKSFLPDFYLNNYDRYLDVKNSYRLKTQKYAEDVDWFIITEEHLKKIGIFKNYRKIYNNFFNNTEISFSDMRNTVDTSIKKYSIKELL